MRSLVCEFEGVDAVDEASNEVTRRTMRKLVPEYEEAKAGCRSLEMAADGVAPGGNLFNLEQTLTRLGDVGEDEMAAVMGDYAGGMIVDPDPSSGYTALPTEVIVFCTSSVN